MIAFQQSNCIVFCRRENAKRRGKFLFIIKGDPRRPNLVLGLQAVPDNRCPVPQISVAIGPRMGVSGGVEDASGYHPAIKIIQCPDFVLIPH